MNRNGHTDRYVEKLKTLNAAYDEEDKRMKELGWLILPLAFYEYVITVVIAASGGFLTWWATERFAGMGMSIAFRYFEVPDIPAVPAAIAGTIVGGLIGAMVMRESVRISVRFALWGIHRFA